MLTADSDFYDARVLDTINGMFPIHDVLFLKNYNKKAVYLLASSMFLGDFYNILHSKGVKQIIPYHVLPLMDPVFEGTKYTYKTKNFLHSMTHVINHNIQYIEMLKDISEIQSREFLAKTIVYRLTASLNAFANAGSYQKDIYFDQPFLPNKNAEEVFVDVGGYSGDTLSSFLEYYGDNYKRYYFFEPEADLVNQAKEIIQNDKVIFYQMGIFNKKDVLKFQINGKGIGAISGKGEMAIKVDAIDNIIKEPPTYIKIVVEGAEMEALQGAENTIRSYKPIVAVACYHKPSHLLDLYHYLKKLNNNYQFYIRAGFNSLYNTVTLFAVNQI
jgi:FkbM family methyltransferase